MTVALPFRDYSDWLLKTARKRIAVGRQIGVIYVRSVFAVRPSVAAYLITVPILPIALAASSRHLATVEQLYAFGFPHVIWGPCLPPTVVKLNRSGASEYGKRYRE